MTSPQSPGSAWRALPWTVLSVVAAFGIMFGVYAAAGWCMDDPAACEPGALPAGWQGALVFAGGCLVAVVPPIVGLVLGARAWHSGNTTGRFVTIFAAVLAVVVLAFTAFLGRDLL